MSEPARSTPPNEAANRTAPGPLRDWLAAMKTQGAPETRGEAQPEASRPEPKAGRAAETVWSPRVVGPAESLAELREEAPEDADLSELMAENLMLKAKLRLEAEHQDTLQAMLAEEIRALREHIRDEIGSLEQLRAEQDEIRAERESIGSERERFQTELEALRTEREALRAETLTLAGERDAVREERDLWRARTEALAQPLFQMQKR